jgi:multicomponent Na+:H+ antiporter subunit C
MIVVLALLVGVMVGCGVALLLHRGIAELLLGFALLGHGVNLGVLAAAGVTRARPPLIAAGEAALAPGAADPLPQALVLTAIVIGFGLTAFAAALLRRVHRDERMDDIDLLGREEA